MPASVLDATIATILTTHENPGGAPAGISANSEIDDFNTVASLTTTTTPAVAKFLCYLSTFGSPLDIDLTAAQGTNGSVDCTGKKLIALKVINPLASAGDVTVAAGPSNGFVLNGGNPIVVAPGTEVMVYNAGVGPAVGGTNKIIRCSGTGGDTPKVAALFG